MVKFFLNVFLVLGVFTNLALAGEMSGVCNKVVDANTLIMNANGKEYTVTLAYIIAPEPGQKFGTQAKQFVEKLALNQNLRILPINAQSGTNITAEVYSPKKIDSINHLLAHNGFAWAANDGTERNPNELGFAFAKKYRLGVWSDPTLTPPIQKNRGNNTETFKSGAQAQRTKGPSGEERGEAAERKPTAGYQYTRKAQQKAINAEGAAHKTDMDDGR